MTRRRISVVVISRNEGLELSRTVANLEDTLPGDGEIIVIDDGSTDGSADGVARRRGRVRLKRAKDLGVARARNWGARLAGGEIVVFADAHIRVPALWWRPLAEILENPRIGGAAPAVVGMGRCPGGIKGARGYGLRLTVPELDARWLPRRGDQPFPAPVLPGCCFAMRRDVFEKTGGWDEGMLLRGGVDNEGCVRFWLFGYDLVIAPDVVVRHKFRVKSPYPIGWGPYLHNRLRLAFAHFTPERLGKVVSALHQHKEFGQALGLLVDRGISSHRAEMQQRRVRTDDWYFERFGTAW